MRVQPRGGRRAWPPRRLYRTETGSTPCARENGSLQQSRRPSSRPSTRQPAVLETKFLEASLQFNKKKKKMQRGKASAEFVKTPSLSEWILRFVFNYFHWFQPLVLRKPLCRWEIERKGYVALRTQGQANSSSACLSGKPKSLFCSPHPRQDDSRLSGDIPSGHSTSYLPASLKSNYFRDSGSQLPLKKAECPASKLDIGPPKPSSWLHSYERSTNSGVPSSSCLSTIYQSKCWALWNHNLQHGPTPRV